MKCFLMSSRSNMDQMSKNAYVRQVELARSAFCSRLFVERFARSEHFLQTPSHQIALTLLHCLFSLAFLSFEIAFALLCCFSFSFLHECFDSANGRASPRDRLGQQPWIQSFCNVGTALAVAIFEPAVLLILFKSPRESKVHKGLMGLLIVRNID